MEYAANKNTPPRDTAIGGANSGPSFARRLRGMSSSISKSVGIAGLSYVVSPTTGLYSRYYNKVVNQNGNSHDNEDTTHSSGYKSEDRYSTIYSSEATTTFEIIDPLPGNMLDQQDPATATHYNSNDFTTKTTEESSGSLTINSSESGDGLDGEEIV
jgi:hypothetical protein